MQMLLLSLFHLRASYSSPSMQPLCHDDESYALLQFKESLVINQSASYGESGDCCSWDGVECDGDSGHVIGLDLSSSCLYGSIDSNSSLFHLVQLRRLNLADNDFNNSEIPSEIRNLSRLFDLDLSYSSFSGQIPTEILELSKIMANLSSLSSLFLRECGLQGEFPMGIFQLPNLRFLSLPGTLGNLKSMKEFDVAECKISGVIPSSLGNLTKLNYLDLSLNKLSGQIPSWMGNHTQLISLYLGVNKLHGPIPESIYRLQNLEELHLAYNFFSGTLELKLLLKFRNLSALHLSNNNFSLLYSHNATFPQPKLVLLTLGGCNLGEFPSFLRDQNHLELLYLADNKFQGSLPIPPPAIHEYKVSNNKFNGEIPKVICDLTSLSFHDLSSNNLSGKLPPCLGNKSSTASFLNLSCNSFSGDIPETFTSGCSLSVIDFSQNKLEGVMRLYEKIQDSLTAIDLSSNGFEGGIPEVLGDLKALHSLNLSNNFLRGGIPSSLSNLKEIESLDLSQNKLSGEIPGELAQLTFLEVFNVSHNFLSGPIPRGNQFGTFDNTSFDANPGLCGEPLSKECGNGEDSLPAAKEDGGSGYPLEFGWKVVVIGYATGLVIGVILGCAMNTRKYEWLVKNYFARWQYKGQNLKTRLHRS
ncbi:hypothetical protein NC651_035848 [Populus alba x Populus x berolinensis]|nr:hypothetical protein NC651_035848 [Populus alba x Populus x berolinensis]